MASHLPFHRSGGLCYSYWCFGVSLESSTSEEGLTLFSGLTPCGGAGQGSGGRALGGCGRAVSAVGGQTSRKRKPLFNRKCPSTKSEIAAERTPADAREGRLWRISRREPPSVARSGGVLRPARCAAHATASWARKVRADVEDAGALARRRRWAGQKGLLMPSWRLCALVQLVGGLFCAVLVSYRSSVCSRCVLCVASGVAVRDSTASVWFGRRSEGRSA